MNINLHIERLILDGVELDAGQRRLLHRSVEVELERLLTQGGVAKELAGGGAVPQVSANGIRLAANDPARMGREIAQSVYGGFGDGGIRK